MSLQQELDEQRNVFGEPIELCSNRPMTGFYRSGWRIFHEFESW